MLTVEEINNFSRFQDLEKEWNELLHRSECDTLFLSHEWLSAWWRNLSKGKSLFILSVKEDNKILALAPFMYSKGSLMKLPVKKIEYIGAGWGYGGIILTTKKEECLEAIWKYIKESEKGNVIITYELSNNYNSIDSFVNTLKKSQLLYLIESHTIPYIPISGSWNDYFEHRSSSFRRNFKNRERRLQRLGTVNFERHNNSGNISEIMNTIFEISMRSWKAKQGTAIASNSSVKNFYLNLAEIFHKRAWLDVSLLKINSKPIAYMFGARYQRKYVDIDIAFDLAYSSISPGNQLRNFLLKELFHDNFIEFDFVMPFDYKKDLTSFARQYNRVIIFQKKLYSKFLFFLRSKLFPILKKNSVRKN